MPKVTVLMPAYNAERWIERAIQSVLDQSFVDFELIVVNDGSTDQTVHAISRFDDRRLRVLEQPKRGIVAALNRGLAEACGPMVARMDADDISYRDRLQRQVAFLDAHPKVAVVGSAYRLVAEDGTAGDVVRVLQRGFDIQRDLFLRCPMGHPTVVYRREAVGDAGGYRADWQSAEDWNLWWRLRDRLANLPEVLLDYRVHESSVSRLEPDCADMIRTLVWAESAPALPWPWMLVAGVIAERKQLPFYLIRVGMVERERLKRRLNQAATADKQKRRAQRE